MKILAFSDFHGSLIVLRQVCEVVLHEQPDITMIAGDIGQGSLKTAKHFLQLLSETQSPVFFVPGNIDDPALAEWNDTSLIFGLHGRCVAYEQISFVGLGGAPLSPFNTSFEYDEMEAESLLRKAIMNRNHERWILLTHAPPRNTKLDRTWQGKHVGSTAVRKIIEEKKPTLAICGHIHEAKGIDELMGIPIVNVGAAIHSVYTSLRINQVLQIEEMSMKN